MIVNVGCGSSNFRNITAYTLFIHHSQLIMARPQRKDKGKSRFTAYMLWAKDVRKEMMYTYPDLDFSTVSRRLGEMWANVPSNEKYNWRRRAKRLASKGKDKDPDKLWQKQPTPTSKFLNRNATGPRAKKQPNVRPDKSPTLVPPTTVTATQDVFATQTTLPKVSTSSTPHFKVTGTAPLDAAAHLKLLGESLTIIGSRLKEHEVSVWRATTLRCDAFGVINFRSVFFSLFMQGQITVSGSLSVLLDSLLCSVVPLMCLVPCIPIVGSELAELKETMANTLDNIAYVMPGL